MAFLEHPFCLLLAQVCKFTLCWLKKTKTVITVAILASHVNKISLFPVRNLINAKCFSRHTDVFNSALQSSAPSLKLFNDHSGRYKAIYAQKKHFCPFGG